MLPISRHHGAPLSRVLATVLMALGLVFAGVPALAGSAPGKADAAHSADGHKADHGDGHGADGGHAHHPELPTFVNMFLGIQVGDTTIGQTPVGHVIEGFHKQILLVVITAALCGFIILTANMRAVMPSRLQVVMEAAVQFLHDLVVGILGPRGKEHVPFLGAVFLFVLFNNLCGIIPLLGAPTSTFQLTLSLALITYGRTLYLNFKWNGFKGYFFHALGSPKEPIMWFFSPLFFALHMIEEIARPASLALRLFGNIMGKDILIGVFMLMGVGVMGAILAGIGIISDSANAPIGIPLQFPFYFLAVLLSAVQALVFTLLSTVYLLLAMPHEHDHDHDHGHEGHGSEGHAPAVAAH